VGIDQLITRQGVVEEFDEAVGLGSVLDLNDGAVHPFHCTAVADGSRTIDRGVEVTYRLVAGRLGRAEASDITAVQVTASVDPG
jgi:cold shock CspA family protein